MRKRKSLKTADPTKAQLSQTKDELTSVGNRIAKHMAEEKELKKRLDKLKKETEKAQKEKDKSVVDAEKAFDKFHKHNKAAGQYVKKADKERAILDEKLSKTRSELKIEQEGLNILKELIKSEKGHVAAMRLALEIEQKELSNELYKEKVVLENMKKAQRESVSNAEKKLQMYNDKITAAEKRLDEVVNKDEKLLEANKKLQEDLTEVMAKIATNEVENKRLEGEISEAKKSVETAQEEAIVWKKKAAQSKELIDEAEIQLAKKVQQTKNTAKKKEAKELLDKLEK